MKSYDFEYDGLKLSDKGFIICNFNSNGDRTVSNGSHITFKTTKTHNGANNELVSVEYDESLTATFSICKHPCNGFSFGEEITLDEIRDMMSWLNRKEYHKFKLLDIEYSNIFFEASFNINKIEFGGIVYGLELELFTNKPYALHNPVPITIENTSANGTKNITSLSDEEGYIYPNMEITINSSGDLVIHNSLEDRTMRIAGCTSGEVIKLKYPMIETSFDSHKIQNDFDWNFFRIASSYRDKVNKLTISLPCTIKMEYTPIIKVGI